MGTHVRRLASSAQPALQSRMLKILALDTSSEMCSVALLMGDTVLARQQLAPQQHAELLLSLINALLVEAGISLNALDAIAFGHGPGSFMGLRVGVGVVQGLAYGADKPVIPISSLQALAQSAYQQYGVTQVVAGLDARMQAVYWGVYQLDADQLMQAVQSDALAKPGELILTNSASFVAAGPAWAAYQGPCPLVFQAEYPEVYPLASGLLALAAYKFQRGEVISAMAAEPYYLRDQVA